jgi:hypothetical protein
LDIGTLSERLHWMWLHEDATRKGYRRSSNEALAQRRGAAANKAKAQKKTKDIANWLKQEFSLEQLAILSDSALTRHLESSNSRAWRGIRGHISRARKTGLLPARQEM